MMRSRWDLALADLEQAASWAHADPRLELAIALAYFECLKYRVNRAPRWLALAERTARDFWRAAAAGSPTKRGHDPSARASVPVSFAAPGASERQRTSEGP